jgi:hypothetical protein
MRRLNDYLRILAWQVGLGYLLTWAITLWTLDEGANVFGKSGVCQPDAAKVLFYWVCDPASLLAILAAVANAALTVTVWAPVYIAAATVQPDAVAIAVPIIAVHLFGLPLGIFVLLRMATGALDLRRGIRSRHAAAWQPAAPSSAGAAVPATAATMTMRAPSPRRKIRARSEFGLRGRMPDVG